MDKLLLIDGHNLLFQMFFGMPSRIINKDGKPIQGVIGFIGALRKIVKMVSPSHIVVLFDGEHATFRSEINPEYKANRIDYSEVPDENNPFSQLQDIYKALDYLKILHTEICDGETDDIIAGYTLKYKHEMEILISSWDSDFFQLIDEKVSVLRYRGKCSVLFTPDDILARYNISPAFYADFKALVGDGSDNIKGLDKIGPKTAAWLINQFGDIHSIIQNAANIAKPSVRSVIGSQQDRLLDNLKLIKLGRKAALPFSINELRIKEPLNIKTAEVLQKIGL